MPHRVVPRFKMDRSVSLELLTPDLVKDVSQQNYTDAHKMCVYPHPHTAAPAQVHCVVWCAHSSFALMGMQFTTPWIAVVDGAGHFLSRLQLTLTYSGDVVTRARWDEVHSTDAAPTHVLLDVRWEHEVEMNAARALDVTVSIGAIVFCVLFVVVLKHHAREEQALQELEDEQEVDAQGRPIRRAGSDHDHRQHQAQRPTIDQVSCRNAPAYRGMERSKYN